MTMRLVFLGHAGSRHEQIVNLNLGKVLVRSDAVFVPYEAVNASPKLLALLLLPAHPLLPPLADPLQDVLPVLVHFQLGDDTLGRVNTNRDRLAVWLLPGDTLDVDDIFEPIDGRDLAFPTFVRASRDENLVVFADRDRASLERAQSISGYDPTYFQRLSADKMTSSR